MKQRVLLIIIAFLFHLSGFAQALTANFSSDVVSGCAPIIVNFTDQSTGSPTKWQWDFGNGSTSIRQNPSTTYITPGTYTVTLTVTNASGATHTVTKTAYINVFGQPKADFSVNRNSGCAPAPIQFTDRSTPASGTTITSWLWDFGDGNTSTEQNPLYTYRTAGNFSVNLTVVTDKGCKMSIAKPNFIEISPGVTAGFTFTDPGVCSAPATINFKNSSSGPGTLTYSWDLGNGRTSSSRNTSATYDVNGLYRVRLLVTSNQGCGDSAAADIQIGKVNTDFTTSSPICLKVPVAFVNNSTPRPISATWKISNGHTDDQRNTSTIFNSPGTYTVTLINNYTVCIDTLVKTITVSAGSVTDFRASDTAKCQPTLDVNFSSTGSAASYQWDFGDGNTSTSASPSHQYKSFGAFNVSLITTSAEGCRDTITKPAYIKVQKPVVKFPNLPAGGCIPYTHNFSAQVEGVDKVLFYSWNFGDGSPESSTPRPSHTYRDSGTYKVSLTITTTTGCTETYTLNEAIRVGNKPVADFTSDVTTACANPGIQFTNLSTGATSWLWQFSDGTTSTQKDPRQVFTDTGFINVTLTAINNGCRVSITKNKYAYIRPPVSRFDYKPNCDNRLEYTFTDKSLGATSWQWDFGDGTSSTAKNPPQHFFPGLGTYKVTLTTTNGSCTYEVSRTVVIMDNKPDFSAANREGCKPFGTTINAKAPNPGAIRTYIWNFGDGTPPNSSQGANGQHTYSKPGDYTVKLTTIDTFGCQNTVEKTAFIRVNGPVANFTSLSSSGCKGMTVTFKDSTITDSRNAIVKWEWDFGDNTTATYTAPPFQHTYDTINDFDVKMVVTDARGCRDSISKRSFVKISTLKAGWTAPPAVCQGGNIGFANSTQSDLPYTSYWTFGDGKTDTVNSPIHVYKDTGYYSVQLIVRDILACQDTLKKDSAVHVAVPKASFTANNFASFCTPFEAKFTNTSYFFNQSHWELGAQQGTTNQHNPATFYTTPGTYPVKLTITAPGGCTDTVTKTIRVYTKEEAKFTYSPLAGCTPVLVKFDAFIPMNGRFVWDFGDGNVVDTTVNKIEHFYQDYGDFIPIVILKEPSGNCIVPLQGTRPISLLGAKPKFTLDSTFFCNSGTIQIKDSTTTNDPPLRYKWNFGDGQFSNATSPSHRYDGPGLYDVTLTVETGRGCKDTLVKGPVKVVNGPLLAVTADTVVCANDKVTYSAVNQRPDTSVVYYWWSFPNGNTSTLQNPPPQQYTTPGRYTVVAVASNRSGCKDRYRGSLLVNPTPVINMPSSVTKIVGVPLQLTPTYSPNIVSYTWNPSSTLSCSTCPQPVATPRFTTKYLVSVVDSNSCRNTAETNVIVLCEGATVFVPNTFSPNGDGSNDMLYVRGVGLDRVKSLRIFNRWGQVVFDKRDFPVNSTAAGWDGTFKGSPAPSDVYIYQIEVFCENSEIIRFEGNITLIR